MLLLQEPKKELISHLQITDTGGVKLRGPGDVAGTQQSGSIRLKIADLVKDHEILKVARNYAQILINSDPELNHVDNINIRSELDKITSNKKIWNLIS
jgi:ATP-dependent DNA helicase RecG